MYVYVGMLTGGLGFDPRPVIFTAVMLVLAHLALRLDMRTYDFLKVNAFAKYVWHWQSIAAMLGANNCTSKVMKQLVLHAQTSSNRS